MEKAKNQKMLIIGGVIVAVIVIGLIAFFVVRGKKDNTTDEQPVETQVKKKRVSAPQNLLPIDKRPLVSLRPFGKSGGRFVSIEVQSLPQKAKSAEYEIVYNVIGASAVSAAGAAIPTPAGEEEGGLQAFIGELDLSQLPTSTENRFGTCSAGGACINNNVDYGTLTLDFDADEKYGVKSDWTYFEKGQDESVTHNGTFSLTADGLADEKDYLILEMIGLPTGLPGEIVTVADDGKDHGTRPVAYQISFTATPAVTDGTVAFPQSTGSGLAVYDGKDWQSFSLTDSVPVGHNYIYALLQ